MRMYSVYDKVSNKWGLPEGAINDAVAQRAFTSWANKAEYKNDFELYYVGYFREETGEFEITPENKKHLVIKGESIAEQI